MLLFKDDLRDDFRLSERSAKAVRYWGSPQESYEHESGVAKECDAYLKLTAERVMFRVKVLGLSEPDAFLTDQELLDVSFIDGRTPKLLELLDPQVRIAMAYVPLSPVGNVGNPVLARLYCAKGLRGRYFPANLLEDGLLPGMEGYSWFFAGLPDEKFDRKIDGRSWLLAASLLMFALQKGDASVVRNLAMKFIVTGDVRNGSVAKVEMGRKGELAVPGRPAFKDFKWIIPKENDMDNIPKRRIEKPATLEEAYSLIESLQGVATRALFRFIRNGDLEGVKEQHKNGADIFSREENTKLTPIQVATELVVKSGNAKDTEVSAKAGDVAQIIQWLKQNGADCAMMYYMLARIGEMSAIKKFSVVYPINAVDGCGLTAVDWALNAEDWKAAELLRLCGATCNTVYQQNEKMRKALWLFCDELEGFSGPYDDSTEDERNRVIKLIVNAIRGGLPYDIKVAITGWCGQCGVSLDCTLFAAAIRHLDYDVIKACLECGANANGELQFGEWLTPPGCRSREFCVQESGTPIEIIKSKMVESEARNKMLKLLADYGAIEA